MLKLQFILFNIGLLICQAWISDSACTEYSSDNGIITDTTKIAFKNNYAKCWKLSVPFNKFIRLIIKKFDFPQQVCNDAFLRLTVTATNETYKICNGDINKNSLFALSDVIVDIYYRNVAGNSATRAINLNLVYEIKDIECIKEDSFKCTFMSCIPKTQVCDGVKNCENGKDEIGCEKGILSIPGIKEAREKAISWIINRRAPSWGWYENTPNAVASLFLADAVNFNGTNLQEELMAKHVELRAAVASLKNSISNEQLSMFINALLVTCHNPKRFYGQNLVRNLKNLAVSSSKFVHPIAYLALCNANESWPMRASTDLENLLKNDLDYPFGKDIQAFAVMAITCIVNKPSIASMSERMESVYNRTIKSFINHQLPDGSFGNVHTTALVTQALISSGQEEAQNWKMNTTVEYLIRKLNSSDIDFYAVYLTLPVFNGKSLSNIAKVDCSAYPRKHGDEKIESDMNDYPGPKIQVQYSLFIGEEKDIVHTIAVKVPENFTAYDVMQFAEVEDPKYKFEYKRVHSKLYVYKIGKRTNNPENGKFWLLYLKSTSNTTTTFEHYLLNADELVLKEDDHLVMWYKNAEL